MNGQKFENLQFLKRKTNKVVSLIKKIEESDRSKMTSRCEEYKDQLDTEISNLNQAYNEFKK